MVCDGHLLSKLALLLDKVLDLIRVVLLRLGVVLALARRLSFPADARRHPVGAIQKEGKVRSACQGTMQGTNLLT